MSSFSETSAFPGFPVSFLYQSPQKVTRCLFLEVLVTHIPFHTIISSCAFMFQPQRSWRLALRPHPQSTAAPRVLLWFLRSPSPLDSVPGKQPRFFCPLCSIHQFNLPLKPTNYLKRKAKQSSYVSIYPYNPFLLLFLLLLSALGTELVLYFCV